MLSEQVHYRHVKHKLIKRFVPVKIQLQYTCTENNLFMLYVTKINE